MEKTIKDLKVWIKEKSVECRAKKQEVKQLFRSGNISDGSTQQWKLMKLRSELRHHHIAYGLLKGRTVEQIEIPHKDNQPDQRHINVILETYRGGSSATS